MLAVNLYIVMLLQHNIEPVSIVYPLTPILLNDHWLLNVYTLRLIWRLRVMTVYERCYIWIRIYIGTR